MKEREIAGIYENEAEVVGKRTLAKPEYHKVVDEIWGNAVSYFLRYLDGKRHDKVLKLDLWDETVADFLSIRKYIIEYLNPKQLLFLEISKSFCKRHKNKFKSENEKPVNGNMIRMPFKENSLDVVVDVSTSDHVDKEFPEAVRELNRVLKRGGYLIFFHTNSEYFNTERFKKDYNFPIYFRTDTEIEKVLENEGFQIIKKNYFFSMFFDSSFVNFGLNIKLLFFFSKILGKSAYTMFDFSPFTRDRKLNWMMGYLARKRF